MANIKAQDLPEKLTKAVKDDRVLMIDSEDYNRLKTQPAEYYRGDDGVSPTVEVVDTPPGTVPAGHTVTITDKNGPKSFFVKDGGGDMEKAVYDKNDNGIVDDAEHAEDADNLGGKPASDYALKEDIQEGTNTKTFYIKGESDLTTAQEIFERYKQGKNPIIIYSNVSFTLSNLFNDRVEFMASKDLPYDNSLCTPACIIYYSGNNVTQVKLRMLTAINVKTINNETILGEGNINITGGAYERPVIKINLTPDKTVYKKGATASITELKAVITKGSADLQSVTFKKNDAVISEVTEGIKDGGEVICNCGTALNNLTENTKLTVEVNDGESVTSEIVNIEFVNPFYYGASASNIVNGTAGFTEDVSTKGNKTYAYSPNWEHNTIIYDDSYGELKDIRDDNGFSLISGFSTGTFEDGTVTYRYYAETNATNDDNVEYTYYFTEGGGGGSGGGGASIAIDTALSTTSGNPVQNKVITTAMQGKQDILESGVNIKTINGNSLLGGGNIEIQGGTGDAYTKAETDTLLADKADKSTTYTKTETDLLLNEKADSIDVYTKLETDDLLADKQDELVSGTNIKTINGNSLLGNGNIEIQGGTTISIDSELSDTSENPVQNKVIKQALDTKANTTDIPDVSNFATKSELPDMTEYYDKAEVDALIPDVSGFITKDVNDLTNYTTTTAMNTALDGKADKSTTYTKTEVDNLIPDVSTLATKTELSAKADATDVNTKTFELASFSDLTTGQAILDWYLAGKNPLISHTYSSASVSGKYTLTLSGTTSTTLVFHIPNFYDLAGTGNLVGTNSLNKTKITITFNSNNEVTSITGGHDADGYFLKADENYATPYTPLYDGSPATKKYVDDSVALIGNNQIIIEVTLDDSVNKNDVVYMNRHLQSSFDLNSIEKTINFNDNTSFYDMFIYTPPYDTEISTGISIRGPYTFTGVNTYEIKITGGGDTIIGTFRLSQSSGNYYVSITDLNYKFLKKGVNYLFSIKHTSGPDTNFTYSSVETYNFFHIKRCKFNSEYGRFALANFLGFATKSGIEGDTIKLINKGTVEIDNLIPSLKYELNSNGDLNSSDNLTNICGIALTTTTLLIKG